MGSVMMRFVTVSAIAQTLTAASLTDGSCFDGAGIGGGALEFADWPIHGRRRFAPFRLAARGAVGTFSVHMFPLFCVLKDPKPPNVPLMLPSKGDGPRGTPPNPADQKSECFHHQYSQSAAEEETVPELPLAVGQETHAFLRPPVHSEHQ